MTSRYIPGLRRSKRSGAERGFTLVEVAVALFILGVTVVAMVEATSGTLRAQAGAERSREAVALAEWKMNHLAASSVDSLKQYLVTRRGEIALPPHRYVWQALVRPARGEDRLWEVAVRVEWDGGGHIGLESVLFRPDLPAARGREGTP
jgi:prepilin-type N-terminal cleavage/methylation domain-containing protein